MASENGWLDDLAWPTAQRELVPFHELRPANTLTLPANTLTAGINTQVVTLKQMATLTKRLAGVVVSAIADRIQRVLTACTPREVLQAVVRLVVVEVPAHQPCGARADEGFQNEMMHAAAAAIRKDDGQTSSATICRIEHATGRTYLPVGADFVALKSGNRLPHSPILEANNAK